MNANFTLKDRLFGAIELTINTDRDKYSYSRYCGIAFDFRSRFPFPSFGWGENGVIVEVTFIHQCILILRKRYLFQKLGDTAIRGGAISKKFLFKFPL